MVPVAPVAPAPPSTPAPSPLTAGLASVPAAPAPSPAVALIPEANWIKSHGETIRITVVAVVDPSTPEWHLEGQNVPLVVAITSSAGDLKNQLSAQFGNMPTNKMQLKGDKQGFLKDSNSLAFYNLEDGSVLSLLAKKRGGRK